jgi:hypothetical protein
VQIVSAKQQQWWLLLVWACDDAILYGALFWREETAMVLPGRAQTFAYENCREMLNKLEREIDRYREVAGVTEKLEGEMLLRHVDQLKDSAFNASVTAWHLADWVFNDLTPNQRQALNLKKLGELQARARKCRALYLCNHVANASKHWSVEGKYHDPTIAAVVECSETGWVGYFLDGATKKPADQVFDAALEFWTHFIYHNGIAKGHAITDISEDEA